MYYLYDHYYFKTSIDHNNECVSIEYQNGLQYFIRQLFSFGILFEVVDNYYIKPRLV
jgi:hypothetical protein